MSVVPHAELCRPESQHYERNKIGTSTRYDRNRQPHNTIGQICRNPPGSSPVQLQQYSDHYAIRYYDAKQQPPPSGCMSNDISLAQATVKQRGIENCRNRSCCRQARVGAGKSTAAQIPG
jgi:hypothetical protein